MKKGIKFSIIVPVYNVELYLKKCIDSILEQTYQEYELILVDDGATDGSSVICDEYAKKDSRIRVIHQSNSGLSVARNKGIDNAKGDYLIFLDSDDYWCNNQVLDKINMRLEMKAADVLSFNYVKFTDVKFERSYFDLRDSMPLTIEEDQTFNYQMEHDLWIACAWNKVIKKDLFFEEKLRFQPNITSEDIDWCMRLALQAANFDFINDIVVCYRQRETSISKSITVKKIDMLIDNIDKCLALLKETDAKSQLLRPYISYQYGTAVYLVATVKEKPEYHRLFERIDKNKYILKWSKNRKIRMMYLMNSIGGMKIVMILLRLREKIK